MSRRNVQLRAVRARLSTSDAQKSYLRLLLDRAFAERAEADTTEFARHLDRMSRTEASEMIDKLKVAIAIASPTLNQVLASLGYTTKDAGSYRRQILCGDEVLHEGTAHTTWIWLLHTGQLEKTPEGRAALADMTPASRLERCGCERCEGVGTTLESRLALASECDRKNGISSKSRKSMHARVWKEDCFQYDHRTGRTHLRFSDAELAQRWAVIDAELERGVLR